MKDIVDVRLNAGFITLTRKQVEDALAELNKPDLPRPFLPGEKVRHHHAPEAVFLVLGGRSISSVPAYQWIANLRSGYTFQSEQKFLEHLEAK